MREIPVTGRLTHDNEVRSLEVPEQVGGDDSGLEVIGLMVPPSAVEIQRERQGLQDVVGIGRSEFVIRHTRA